MDLDKVKERFEILKNIDEILDRHIDNEDYADRIKYDMDLSDDAICFLIGEYYLTEISLPPKERFNPQFVQTIKEHYIEKKGLCDWFRLSSIFVDNLVNNYTNCYWYTREENLKKLSLADQKILNTLEPAYYFNNTTYLTTIIRVFAHNLNTAKYGDGSSYRMNIECDFRIRPNMIIESIISDTYSYLKYEKKDSELLCLIEKMEPDELKRKVTNNVKLYDMFMKYYFEMHKNGIPNFYEIYLTNEHQDEKYKQKMLKLNSLYNVDKIAAFTNKNME